VELESFAFVLLRRGPRAHEFDKAERDDLVDEDGLDQLPPPVTLQIVWARVTLSALELRCLRLRSR
jgi:hypothetical protein